MRDGHDCASLQFLPQNLLHLLRGLEIDACGRLVHDHDCATPQHRSGDVDQLPLSLRQIFAPGFHVRVELPGMAGADAGEDSFAFGVAIFVERVEIFAHRAGEQDWILRKEGLNEL